MEQEEFDERLENHYSPKFKLEQKLPANQQSYPDHRRPIQPTRQPLLQAADTENDDSAHIFKILLIGDANVGKTSLLLRFCEDDFNENLLSTIGIDFREKIVDVDDRIVRLQIWDTAGQERFRSMSNSFYRGSHGILVVYDITNRKSFDHVSTWLSEIARYCATDPSTDHIVKTIVGNKCDLNDLRMVSFDSANDLARKVEVTFLETSALNRVNVEKLFLGMARSMLENATHSARQAIVKPIKETASKNSSCC